SSLQQLHTADGLCALRVGACASGIGLCVLLCAADHTGVFAVEAGSEQSGFVADELLSQLGRKLRHCARNDGERTQAELSPGGHRSTADAHIDRLADGLAADGGLSSSTRVFPCRCDEGG